MITNISLVTLFVTDQAAAKASYTELLGFVERTDVRMGDGFRWLTIAHPDHPELEVTLMVPGPPLDDEMATAVRRSLAKGRMGGVGLSTDDCRKTVEELRSKGVKIVFGPQEYPDCYMAVVEDPWGNPFIIHQRKDGTVG